MKAFVLMIALVLVLPPDACADPMDIGDIEPPPVPAIVGEPSMPDANGIGPITLDPNGNATAKDAKWYFGLALEAAKAGDAESQFTVGSMYANGLGTAKDLAQAAVWFRKAADQGRTDAQVNLASLYLRGQGVAKDVPEALRLFKSAAEAGDPKAQSNLGNLYATGKDVPLDLPTAASWLRKAAHQGNVVAAGMLGAMHMTGRGAPVERVEAVRLLTYAADRGFPPAMLNLGLAYANAQVSGHPEVATALKWFLIARDHPLPSMPDIPVRAAALVTRAKQSLTPAEIAKAEQAAKGWVPQASEERPRPDGTQR